MNMWRQRAQGLVMPVAAAAFCALAVTACGGGASSSAAPVAETGVAQVASAGTAAAASISIANTGTGTATTTTADAVFGVDTAQALGKKSTGSGSTTPKVITQPANTEGRLLASNCFQCHGTLGTGGFESIRGKEASEVMEFMTKTANRDIMAAHAQGYTTAQLQKIIAYLQQ